ncbi:DUF928 domain-containing protein [Leptolyngbya ohadii]|uniref:DUF928 domain-containing protein n=1 Tax=Leptolyngbya ohadii TaxID=1962290 RepID=UPI000B59E529|nr:DUF928 domain-containing protein [Leptolyngbya ohadii]
MGITSRKPRFLFIISLFLLTIAVLVEKPGLSEPEPAVDSNSSSIPAQIQEIWSNVFRSRRPAPRRRVSRPGEFCSVAIDPLSSEALAAWSPRPTFVWQGAVESIELKSADSQQVLAQMNLSNLTIDPTVRIRHVTYTGDGVQPGQDYQWVVTFRNREPQSFAFRVMPSAEFDRIKADLQTLTSEQRAAGASAETIALRQADYFAERQLWSDFWRTALLVEQPSPELKTLLQSIATDVCSPPQQ